MDKITLMVIGISFIYYFYLEIQHQRELRKLNQEIIYLQRYLGHMALQGSKRNS